MYFLFTTLLVYQCNQLVTLATDHLTAKHFARGLQTRKISLVKFFDEGVVVDEGQRGQCRQTLEASFHMKALTGQGGVEGYSLDAGFRRGKASLEIATQAG